MQANVLVFDHDAPGLQRIADIEVLLAIEGRGHQAVAQLLLGAVIGEGDAIHRTDVDTGIALDAQRPGKHRLDIAIEATLGLEVAELFVETDLDLDPDILQRYRGVPQRYLVAQVVRDVVVVAPLVDAHLLADERYPGRRSVVDILAVAQFVDRDRGVVAVGNGPDDVLRPKRGVAAKEYFRQGRLHRLRIDLRHVPAVKLDADVALDPREGVLLTDRDQHVVARSVLVGFAGRDQVAAPARVVLGLNLLEQYPGQPAALMGEFLRHQPVEDRDAFVHRILFLPGRGLHLLKPAAHDDGDFVAAEPARGAAAIHRRVAAAEDDDTAPDLVDVAERDAGEPVDTDMDVVGRLVAAGDVEVAPARRAAADKDRVPIVAEQALEAFDIFAETGLDTHFEDQVAFFIGDRFGQAETRDLGAHHPAALDVAVEHHALIAEWQEVAGDGQRGRSGTNQRNALAVLLSRYLWQIGANVTLIVGGDTLEPADRHRLLLDPPAPACRLARPVAGAPQDAGKDVRPPIDHKGVGIAPLGDQPDVFGDRRMRRTGPLAIDDFVKIVRNADIGGLH